MGMGIMTPTVLGFGAQLNNVCDSMPTTHAGGTEINLS